MRRCSATGTPVKAPSADAITGTQRFADESDAGCERPHRHSLVWLTPGGWDAVQAASIGAAVVERDAVARWRAADWPVVATRRAADLAPRQVAVGLALPPDRMTGSKVRRAYAVGDGDIRRHAAALGLAAALTNVPAQWRAPLAALHLEAAEVGLSLQVFGSLAWQTITGMSYLNAASDIDLLCLPTCERELAAGVELLDRYARVLPLDGEVIFPPAAGVAWKEWRDAWSGSQDASQRVLVKHSDRVSLTPCSVLLATLMEP